MPTAALTSDAYCTCPYTGFCCCVFCEMSKLEFDLFGGGQPAELRTKERMHAQDTLARALERAQLDGAKARAAAYRQSTGVLHFSVLFALLCFFVRT